MVKQLKELLGKNPRPIVVEGKLLTTEGGDSLILGYKQGYKLMYKDSKTKAEFSTDIVAKLIQDRLSEFADEYRHAVLDTATKIFVEADPFSGCICIFSERYAVLSNVDTHRTDRQYPADVQELLDKFLGQYMVMWFELYMALMNRKLSGQSVPVKIKAHLVAGFFQPVVLNTEHFKHPIQYGACEEVLNGLHPYLVSLEQTNDTLRHIDLSVIATADIAQMVGVETPIEMDRREFQLMLVAILLSRVGSELLDNFLSRWSGLSGRVMGNQRTYDLFAGMIAKFGGE